MSTAPSIVISGYYGFANNGDELILSTLSKELGRCFPSHELTVISAHPALTQETHGLRAVSCFSLKEIARSVRSASLVIMGGGGILHDYLQRDSAEVLSFPATGLSGGTQVALLARLYGRPLVFLSLGVGPFATQEGKTLADFILKLAHKISVRDETSRTELGRLDPRFRAALVPDPVFGLSLPDKAECRRFLSSVAPRAVDPEKPILGVSLRPWPVDDPVWLEQVGKGLAAYVRRCPHTVCLIPFQETPGSADREAHRAVSSKLPDSTLVLDLDWFQDPVKTALCVGACDLTLSMRLHAVIVSAVAGTPTVALAYDPKVTATMELLGQKEYVISWEDLDSEVVEKLLSEVSGRRQAISRQLQRRSGELGARVSRHLSTLPEWLASRGETVSEDSLPEIQDHFETLLAERQLHEEARSKLISLGKQLLEESQRLASERRGHEATHRHLLAVGEELKSERERLGAERRAHDATHARLVELGEDLQAERVAHDAKLAALGEDLQAERMAHDATHARLAALSEGWEAERRAHDETYRKLLAVGDELIEERQQLGAERQKHSETLQILQDIYASRAWKWLERLRRWRHLALHASRRERWDYFRQVAGKLGLRWHWGVPAGGSSVFPAGPQPRETAGGQRLVERLPIAISSRKSVRAGRAILKAILEANGEARGIIVYPPTVDWDYPLFQRPHHMALGLAQNNFLFLYLSPNRYDRLDGTRQVAERLYVINLPVDCLDEVPGEKAVLYISWAANYLYREIVPHRTFIYDYLDAVDLADSPSPKSSVFHTSALKEADIVLTTAENLYRETRRTASRVVLCPNGVEYQHFSRESYLVPEDVKPIVEAGKPIVGYYGALAKWLDYPLVRLCAERFPHWNFLLIGLDYDGSLGKSNLLSLPNVHFLGAKPYSLLPHYLHAFTIATIPFAINRTTVSTNPIKIFEFMAARKPVVTTALPECRRYQGVLCSRDAETYCKNLEAALELSRDDACLSMLAEQAKKNAWEKRIEQVVAELSRAGF